MRDSNSRSFVQQFIATVVQFPFDFDFVSRETFRGFLAPSVSEVVSLSSEFAGRIDFLRVIHLPYDLGWVDLDFECSTV